MRVQKDGMQVTWRQAAYMARDSCAAAASAGLWCCLLTHAAAAPHSCATPARASARAFSAAFMA